MQESPDNGFNEYRPTEIPPEMSTPPQPSRIAKFFSACVHAVFYVMLFVGCQSVVVGVYLSSLIAGTPAAYTDQEVINSLVEQVNEKTVLILLISNLLTFLLINVIMHIRHREPLLEFELYPVNPFRLVSFALFGVAMNIFISVTMSLLPLPEELLEEHNSQTMSLYGEMPILLEILSVAVIAGIVEELIFRGLVISRLNKGMGTAAAVVISALLFGFAHGTALAVVYATLLGLLLGALYARYSSILPGIIFHVFFNTTSYLLPEEGTVLTVLYIVSIVLVIYCVWSIFIRFPVFNDIFTDVRNRIRAVNEEDAAILVQLKYNQKIGKIMTLDLEAIRQRWEENRRNAKKEKRRK